MMAQVGNYLRFPRTTEATFKLITDNDKENTRLQEKFCGAFMELGRPVWEPLDVQMQ